MMKKIIRLLCILFAVATANAQAAVVVIGHAGLGKLDKKTVKKIYTGKVIEVEGTHITPVNAVSGQLRDQFLHEFLNQNDEKYTAYWTVRRYIGKGVPPKELPDTEEMIRFIQSTPGAIGYLEESEATQRVNVIAR